MNVPKEQGINNYNSGLNDSVTEKIIVNEGLQQYLERSSDGMELVSFDEILTKIGFGKYQLKLFVIMGLCGIMDGSESLVLSLVLPILQKVWHVSDLEQSLLGSLVYFGLMIGSYFSGYFADQQGRQKPLVISSLIIFLFALSSAFSINITLFIITRFLYGVGVGFIMPISFTMLGEVLPVQQRGFFLVLIGVFYTLGQLLACSIAFFTMDSLTSGNWRALLAFSSLPAILVFIFSFKFVDESARYLLTAGIYSEAQKTIEQMALINGQDPQQIINARVMIKLKGWSDRNQREELEIKGVGKNRFAQTMSDLFSGSFQRITPIIWFNWFTASFVYFGITFIFPLTLSQIDDESNNDNQNQSDNLDLWQITVSSLGQLPTIIVAAFIVNIPQFGRQNTWAFSFLLGGLSLVFVFIQIPTLLLWITVSKLSLDLAFSISYQYTAQIYPTYMRTNGLGLAGSFSRIGGVLMPWIGIYISKIGIFFPYFIFGICSLLSGVLSLLLPYDTLNQQLDQLK